MFISSINCFRASCEMFPSFKTSISALNSRCRSETLSDAFFALKSTPNIAFEKLSKPAIKLFKGSAIALIIKSPTFSKIAANFSKDSATDFADADVSLFFSTNEVNPPAILRNPSTIDRPTKTAAATFPSFPKELV